MNSWRFLRTAWEWEPEVIAGCFALVAIYWQAMHLRQGTCGRGAKLAFLSGVALLLLALVSPLHVLADRYLFSAHMLQHLLMVLIIPPLLLLGLPATFVRRSLAGWPRLGQLERVLRRPEIAGALGLGTVILWHVPALYNAALAIPPLHQLEHLCFLVTATIFWWPVVGRPLGAGAAWRLPPLAAVLYLAVACVVNSGLGIVLTFAPPGLYPAYLFPYDLYGILPLLRNTWGLTPAVDQQVGGLLMWLPGGLVYLVAILAKIMAWFDDTPGNGFCEAENQSADCADFVHGAGRARGLFPEQST